MKASKNSKGMTLMETIIALAVLGIVTAPLLTVFVNSAFLVKKAGDRLEINAVTRIIKENVTNSVKYGGSGHAIETFDSEIPIDLNEDSVKNGYNLAIVGSKGERNEKYKFDAERTADFGELNHTEAGSPTALTDTCEYLITLKTMEDSLVQRLRILINRVD